MTALIGYIVVTVLTGAVVARLAHWERAPAPVRASADLADTARTSESDVMYVSQMLRFSLS